MRGVIYTKKDPADVVSLFEKYPPSCYIYLMLDSQHRWKELLDGQEINADDCVGINPEYLIEYGAILKNYEPVTYKDREIVQILFYQYRYKNIVDAIKRVKGKCSARYIIHFNNRLSKFEDKYGI